MDPCGTESLCTQCGATLAHVSPEELAARIRERDQARDVAGWRQGDEYDRADYQRRAAEGWHAARENAEEILKWNERALRAEERLARTDEEFLRCLKKHEAERAASFEEGMRSVLRQRCIEHRDVPQLNENAHGVGECGACVQDFWRNTYASTATWTRRERENVAKVLRSLVQQASDPPWTSSNTAWLRAIAEARTLLAEMDRTPCQTE